MKAFTDKYLDFTISKKLTVFIIACVGLFCGVLESQEWTNISIMYIGTQGVIDLILKLRG